MRSKSAQQERRMLFYLTVARAVYVDLAPDYSVNEFLMVLRRFVAIRGYPLKLHSDQSGERLGGETSGPVMVGFTGSLHNELRVKSWQNNFTEIVCNLPNFMKATLSDLLAAD